MGYENFISKDPLVTKIIQNAKKFGEERLQNEALVARLLDCEKISLDQDEKDEIEKIFLNLMKIEEEAQLSG